MSGFEESFRTQQLGLPGTVGVTWWESSFLPENFLRSQAECLAFTLAKMLALVGFPLSLFFHATNHVTFRKSVWDVSRVIRKTDYQFCSGTLPFGTNVWYNYSKH